MILEEGFQNGSMKNIKTGLRDRDQLVLNKNLTSCNARINSATKNLLTTKSVNPSENSDPNLALKERIFNAKSNANKLR